MALIDAFIVFAVGLLIGAIGIYFGGRAISGEGDYLYALGTAFIGSLVWSVVSFFFGGLPLIGPFLALVSWIWVLNLRYSGGWTNAVLIGLVSWFTVIAVLVILASLGIGSFEAFGVPV